MTTPALASPNSASSPRSTDSEQSRADDVIIDGQITKTDGTARSDMKLNVMLTEYLSEADVEAGRDARFIVVPGGTTDARGRFHINIRQSQVPDQYITPDGNVHARLVGSTDETMVHHVATFKAAEEGEHGKSRRRVASAETVHASEQPVSAEMRKSRGALKAARGNTRYGQSVKASGVNPDDYCDYNSEEGYWEEINTARHLDANIGQIFTHGGTEQVVGVYRQSTHRNEVFLVAGGTRPVGRDVSRNTAIDWALRIPQNHKVDVKAVMDYRYHQVYCINIYGGEKRYPGVGEWYPYRATGGTSVTATSAPVFACDTAFISHHAGTQILNVARGKTRVNTAGINLSGTLGGVSVGFANTTNTTTFEETRFSVYGKRAATSRFGLCGTDNTPAYASNIREIVL